MCVYKNELVNSIILKMSKLLSDTQLDQLKSCLHICCYNYNITKIETTEVSLGNSETTQSLLEYYSICKLGSGRSRDTIKQYIRVAHQLCCLTNKEINMITSDDIIYFLAKYPHTRENGICNSTMDTKRRYLSSIFGLLKKHKKISENPMETVESLKCKIKLKQPLSNDEVDTVKETISHRNNNVLRTRNTMIVNLLLDTGCRVSELCGIDICDIDFNRNEIKVLGKGNKERLVLFSESTKRSIYDYLSLRDYKYNDPLIMDLSGTVRLKASGVQSMMRNLRKKCGINRIHCHLFRKTCATDLVHNGISIDIAAKYLGHSGLGSIQRYVLNDQEYTNSELKKVGLGITK